MYSRLKINKIIFQCVQHCLQRLFCCIYCCVTTTTTTTTPAAAAAAAAAENGSGIGKKLTGSRLYVVKNNTLHL